MDELSDRSLYEEQNKAITAEAEACDAYLVIERDFNQAVQEEKELEARIETLRHKLVETRDTYETANLACMEAKRAYVAVRKY